MKILLFLTFLFCSAFLVERTVVDEYADRLRVDHRKIEDAIFKVAKEDGLVKGVRELAIVTRDSFDAIIKDLPPRKQYGMYEMMRRPELLRSYAIPNLKDEEIRFVFRNYSPAIADSAVKFHREHFDIISQLNQLQQYTKTEFSKALFGYPIEAQEAMKFLIDFPQILELLTRDNPTTRHLRKTYLERPDLFVVVVDSIALQISKEYNASIDEWVNSIESDPEKLKAFEKAAGAYESHLESQKETHNQTMMAKNQQPYKVSGSQQQYFEQYGTSRSGKQSNVHVSVWVGAGYGWGYGRPYWYNAPYMGGAGAVYGGAYYNPYHNPYWF